MIYIIFVWLLLPLWLSIALLRKLFIKTPKNVLFMEIAGIGDVVCSAVIFKEFKNAYPNAKIDLMLEPVASGLAPLLPIDNIIKFAYKEQKGFRGRVKLALICAKYDIVICLIPSAAQLSAICFGCVPYRYSVLPNPLGSTYTMLKPLLTNFSLHNNGSFFIETQAKILQNFKELQNLDSSKIDKWLPKDKIKQDELFKNDISHIGVLVSSAREMKRIPIEQIATLINTILNNKENSRVVLIGSAQDGQIAKEILERCNSNKIIDTTGKYSLSELPNLLIGLELFVGVDSGVTHMADALGLSVVCIGGPMNLDEVYKTKATVQKISVQNLECFPCLGVFITPSNCKTGTLECIKNINYIEIKP